MPCRYGSTNPHRREGKRTGKFYSFGRGGYLDLLALRISKHWGQHPNWFATLKPETKIKLIAEYRLHNETEKQYNKRKKMYNDQEITKRIERQRAKHANKNKTR